MTKLFNLNDFDLVSVQGPDSLKFLQGQLTCNVDRVSTTQSITGAYCNLKGRVITDFRIFIRDGTYYLQTEKGLGEVLQKTLDKYIVFSKAKTESVGDNFKRIGLCGEGAVTLLHSIYTQLPQQEGACQQTDELIIIKLNGPQQRYEIYYQGDSAEADRLMAGSEEADTGYWRLADIEAGIVHISPAMQEIYTPQLLNYDIRGLVDFKKGCYTGQEIVARMHYRAMAKKRLYRLTADISQADKLVLNLEGSENPAEIITAYTQNGITHLLAILPCEEIVDRPPVLTLTVERGAIIEQVPARFIPLPCFENIRSS